jgi:DNA recombination protein RmuC
MDTTLLVLLIILLALLVAVLFFVGLLYARLRRPGKEQNSEAMALLNQNMQAIQQRIDTTNQAIGERLDNAARVIGAVNKELGSMQQVGLQLKDFQNFLRSPKLRGNLGEQGLKDLLSQILPKEFYTTQHRFKSGATVDIAIKIDAGIIPVDAKFPLENFNRYISIEEEPAKTSHLREFRRDFKKHVDDIASKYLGHEEGTLDFAFLYLPSESVFFEMLNNKDLHDLYQYSTHKKIILASPSTFFYYLRTIMLGLEGRRINEMSTQILKVLQSMKSESHKVGDNLSVLSRHLVNAKNMMDTVTISYTQLASKIDQASNIKPDDEEAVKKISDGLTKNE